MDLIYADKNKTDIGVLKNYTFDLAYGEDENNFEITVAIDNNVCGEGFIVYIEGTEYGGVIDSIEVNTGNGIIKYKGRTFHGILDKQIIAPFLDQDYYVVSGYANSILNTLIGDFSLRSLFKASEKASPYLQGYAFDRYIPGYKGIKKMLKSVNRKLKIEYKGGYAWLEAVPIDTYNDDNQINSDKINFNIQKSYNVVNHLVCLGPGELKDRMIVHLYMDKNGDINTSSKKIWGIEEICEVYDYPNAESREELIKGGKERLRGQDTNNIDLNLSENMYFDIGDKILVTENVTGVTVEREITKKIVTIKDNLLNINYKVGG